MYKSSIGKSSQTSYSIYFSWISISHSSYFFATQTHRCDMYNGTLAMSGWNQPCLYTWFQGDCILCSNAVQRRQNCYFCKRYFRCQTSENIIYVWKCIDCCCIFVQSFDVYIVAFYHSPWGNFDTFLASHEIISSDLKATAKIIAGPLNLHYQKHLNALACSRQYFNKLDYNLV